MAKVQGKKAAAAGKSAAKKVAARVKSAAGAAKKKVAPKKAATPPKPAAKKTAVPKKPVKKAAAAAKTVAKASVKAAKAVKTAAKKAVAKVAKPVVNVAKAAKAAKAAAPKAAPKAPKPPALKVAPKAVPPPPPRGPVAVPPPPPAARAPEPEKKRGRRARPRVTSSGAPAAAWLSTEKPRPASFIPAPARAEAPSAVAAPPASSDRLIRPDDVEHPAVRIVPIRIDVEQGAGRFYVHANPMEATIRPGEGIEWDFRYLGGADVSVEEVVVEFEKPSPFGQASFRTRKPGGARPHRQLSGGALPAAAGRRIQYTVRAINPFKTELANTRIWVTITS